MRRARLGGRGWLAAALCLGACSTAESPVDAGRYDLAVRPQLLDAARLDGRVIDLGRRDWRVGDGAVRDAAVGAAVDAAVDGAVGDAGGAADADLDGRVEPPPCDPRFSFDPDPPVGPEATVIAFTHPEPLVFVDLQVLGPHRVTQGALAITTTDPWTWAWPVTGLSAGAWTLVFSADDPQAPNEYGRCTVQVR